MIQTDPFVQIGASTGPRTGMGARRRPSALAAPFVWLGGMVASALALAVGAVLALVTAAAVALIAVFAGALVFLAGLALRARRQGMSRRRTDGPDLAGAEDGVIEARKIDGAWVAYGWERKGR